MRDRSYRSFILTCCGLAVLFACTIARAQEYVPNKTVLHAPLHVAGGPTNPATLLQFSQPFSDLGWPATSADVKPKPWQNWGKQFYVAFLAAVGSQDDNVDTKTRSLFIVSKAPARVYLENVRGRWTDTVVVAPGSMAKVDVPLYVTLNRTQYEVAVPAAIYVHSDQDISVYGYTHNDLSSDGYTAFPVESLGKDYVIMSARNALNYADPFTIHPRSEFAIVATQNGTRVNLHLTATAYSGRLLADSTYSVILSRGDVLPIFARDTGIQDINGWYVPWLLPGMPDCDLTGSRIVADKPIAVFSGHERAASPSSTEFSNNPLGVSRDHLVEQLPPIDLLGTKHLVVSSEAPASRPQGGDMIRVVAAFDNTIVKVNNVAQATLAAGGFTEFMAGKYCTVDCNEPSLVVRFEQTALTPDTLTLPNPPGDPDMTIVRPIADWSTGYSLASWPDYKTFTDPRTMIVVDTNGINDVTINGKPVSGFTRIPASTYAYGYFKADGSEQRIQSSAPCYAEAYGFGYMDSYTFAAGGEYSYIDSLFAIDLDFKIIPAGTTRDLTSNIHSRTYPDLSKDTVLVYGYEWVSGDTNSFTLLDGVTQPLRVLPGKQLPLPVRFHPDANREYRATLRVWSSARNQVFVHLIGAAARPKIRVTPDTINFGRVRLSTPRDSLFTIENVGAADLHLQPAPYSNQLPFNSPFFVDGPSKTTIVPSTFIQCPVHFAPTKDGYAEARINVQSDDPDSGIAPRCPTVTLIGIGVIPKVASIGSDFGALRVSAVSPKRILPIYNYGSDTTRIDSVVILPNSDRADFTVTLDSFPPFRAVPVRLGYQNADSNVTYSAVFSPQSLGKKRLIVAIYTLEKTVYDTLTGTGVEPLVRVGPPVVDFGTITVSKLGDPNPTPNSFDLPFTVSNDGSYVGQLLRLVYHDSTHFKVRLDKPAVDLAEPIATGQSISGTASFFVTEEGDFIDTVTVTNDTRYSLYGDTASSYIPRVILMAKVRTGPIDSSFAFFDTVTTCDPEQQTIVLHNPYPVEVHIDSIRLGDNPTDTLGFSFGGFGFPINIAPDKTFEIPLTYVFPDELLNGPQTVTLILYQRQGGGQPPIQRRVTASLIRKRRTLTLRAELPSWISSASDEAPMRVPIKLEGPRANVGELDSFKLELKFSNDLFMPIGIDDLKSLIASPGPNGYVHTSWDQSTRTYTILAVGVPVSDPARLSNDLLMTVVMRAFLTLDSEVTVTPTFTFLKHPCAYNLEPFTLSIPYANECGEPIIRDFMAGKNPVLDVVGIRTNPLHQGEDLTLTVDMATAGQLEVVVSTANGSIVSRTIESRTAGIAGLTIPSTNLPHSGTAFVTLRVGQPDSGLILAAKTVKIAISE